MNDLDSPPEIAIPESYMGEINSGNDVLGSIMQFLINEAYAYIDELSVGLGIDGYIQDGTETLFTPISDETVGESIEIKGFIDTSIVKHLGGCPDMAEESPARYTVIFSYVNGSESLQYATELVEEDYFPAEYY